MKEQAETSDFDSGDIRHLMVEIQRLDESIQGLTQTVQGISIEVAKLQTKAGFIGAIAGAFVAFLASVPDLFKK